MDAVLETRSLCKSFGALTVAQSIDFRLRPGDRHALIGPNGAGKTTFVNMLMGALRPSSGRILLGGDDVTRAPQAQRVKRGLGRTFQINSLFRNLPGLDNVALAVAERRRIALRMWRAASRCWCRAKCCWKARRRKSRATGASMTSISASSTMADALKLERVRAGYGQTVVLEDVDLVLRERGALAVLGRNGVGKTTLLATIMGHTTFHSGEILLSEKSISRVPVYQRARLGVGFVPQEREIFASLSVEENLGVAAQPGRWTLERVYDLFPRLAERRSHQGNQISGGEQQMLAIGRALMGNPSLMLMDEPLEGLAPIIIESLLKVFNRLIAEDSLALVLVEQHAKVALGVTHHAMVLNRGRVAHYGPSAALLADPQRLSSLIVDLG